MSSAVFFADGSTVDVRPGEDVAAGSIVVIGDLLGVAKFAIVAGAFGAVAVRGVFDVVKDPSTNIDAGTVLYWSEISQHVVKTQSGHRLLGKSIRDAPVGTSTVRVVLTQ